MLRHSRTYHNLVVIRCSSLGHDLAWGISELACSRVAFLSHVLQVIQPTFSDCKYSQWGASIGDQIESRLWLHVLHIGTIRLYYLPKAHSVAMHLGRWHLSGDSADPQSADPMSWRKRRSIYDTVSKSPPFSIYGLPLTATGKKRLRTRLFKHVP